MNQIPVTQMPDDEEQTVLSIVSMLKDKPGALLPILHEIQAQLGYVPEKGKAIIAQHLNLSRAEVHGVVSFYHFFRTQPGGRHQLYVCRAEACQSRGGSKLEQEIKDWLGLDYHQTDPSGEVELQAVYCLGQCATAPSIRLDDQVFSRMDLNKVIRALKKHTALNTEGERA